ncbi:heavy metal translocating P-type ATPase [Oceanisphaera pacifica]|uniref:Cation-translocating P-type ATPase n=1 Tax=Oceanisphaera pacifica TaxID=2818389 RepID=A0ABS3NGJ1_9GAMM|nr:cation-translocating P-type ATPase [Oceanisphaera pacifica]MBO1519513.1 cation-translocating P-type ATPase [Oceanisphaera pacifica]
MQSSATCPDLIDECAQVESGTPDNSAVFMVQGMRCGSCAIAIEAVLKKQANVSDAAVNFSADIAMIHWQQHKPDITLLKRAVARLGYELHTSTNPERSAQHAHKMRLQLQLRLAVAVVLGMWSMMPAILLYLAPFGAVEPEYQWALALANGLFAIPVILYSGSHFYRVGWRTLLAGAPGLDSLITLAVIAACGISIWQLNAGSHHVYFDAAVMLITFQLIARLLDSSVRRRASEVVHRYFQAIPDTVTVKNDAGEWVEQSADMIKPGQSVALHAGQQLALDGVVKSGSGQADLSLLTGEHAPQVMTAGDELLAGCTVLEGELELIITASVGERRIDRLSHSISDVLSRKTALQQLTDRIARALIPIIMVAAVFAVLLALWQGMPVAESIARGVAVLIVSCPCALSLAIPLVVTMGHSSMLQQGIVLRDPSALESAANIKVVVFDKTGTLTTAEPSVQSVQPASGVSENELLQLATHILHEAVHPTAKGLQALLGDKFVSELPGMRESIVGEGTRWHSGQGVALAGRASWLIEQGVALPPLIHSGMQLHLASQGHYKGSIYFHETVREGVAETIHTLRQRGVAVYLLSGDTQQACSELAARVGIEPSQVLFERTPEQKHRFIEALEKKAQVAFVGDGLNDGLALAGAGLGIAVGQASSATGMAAAIYLSEGVTRVPVTLELAYQSRTLMYQNLFWALAYNALVIPLALWGWIHPVIAAIAMSLSSVCVLFNSVRAAKK